MNTKSLLGIAVAAALCAGCEGTGPNTQNGAVAGGALGALAGAVIGNNSAGHNALGGAVIGGVVGAIAGGTIGNSVDHQNGTIYGSEYAATTHINVYQVPPMPAPQADVYVAQPSPSAVWVPGYYDYAGPGYVWIAGHWEIPPPGAYRFIRPHWVNRGGSYVFIRAYWR